MKKSVEEHAARFDEYADEYDEDKSEEYRATVSLVVERARDALSGEETVLDLGCGTGAIALRLVDDAGHVVGRDVSDGMLERAEDKARDRDVTVVADEGERPSTDDERAAPTLELGEGRFRAPNYGGPADAVVSNFAMHHLSDAEKREAIDRIAEYDPDRVVLGDVMFFGEPDPDEPFYSPEVDDPSTAGHLADCFTSAGFALTAVERVHDQVGVLVADRLRDD